MRWHDTDLIRVGKGPGLQTGHLLSKNIAGNGCSSDHFRTWTELWYLQLFWEKIRFSLFSMYLFTESLEDYVSPVSGRQRDKKECLVLIMVVSHLFPFEIIASWRRLCSIKGDSREQIGADTLWTGVNMPHMMTGRSGVHCALLWNVLK